jgi:HK97 family phage prohead protease
MPYFITDKAEGCSGWATIKDDGEIMGCHKTKQDAIDQMVAISLAEDMEVGGERIESGPLAVIVDIDGTLISGGRLIQKTYNYIDDMQDTEIFIVTGRNDSERESTVAELDALGIDYDRLFMNPSSTADTPEFKKATAEKLLEEFNVIIAIDNNPANRKVYRELGITALDVSDVPDVPSDENDPDEEDVRAINQDAPAFMRAAARRGLAFYEEGKGGDGLVDRTIREARLMAEGNVSDDKWIRIAAWIARHMSDLDAPAANPSNENYPSAGVVAHFLWGSGASKQQAMRTQNYAERVVERIRAQEEDRNTLQNDKWKSIALNLNKDERQQMTTQVERRVNTVEFDVRNGEASSDGMSFTGYAAVFNSPSEPLPFTEVIKEGAFKRSLKSRNEVKLFMNHNTDVVLGSTRAGTLRLSEDSRGLLAQADLPDTSAGRDLSVLMKRGDVSSMSFGFSVPPKGDAWSKDGATRELHQIRLHEVSIVTGFPAYAATTASVRSLDILATRTAVDVDALSDAITRLEAGETLEPEHADLISEVVSKLRATEPANLALLELKRKQLDLMAKVF